MGNCCGKTDSEAFAQPGRVLGSADAPPQSQPRVARVPARQQQQQPPSATETSSSSGQDDARRKAAEAAEARAQSGRKGTGTGKLQSQLDAQKKQTRSDTLQEASAEERRMRDAAEGAQACNWN